MGTTNKNIYTDLDNLPIYNFSKCVKGDLKFMYESKSGKVTKDLQNKWDSIYNNYCELTISNEVLSFYRLTGEIVWLENRLKIAPLLINILTKTPKKENKEVLKQLSAWRLPINNNKDLVSEINKVLKILNNSKNKLNRKRDEYNSIKDKNSELSKQDFSLSKQKVKLHKLLGIDVNTHTTSVTEWLSYWGEVKELKNKK